MLFSHSVVSDSFSILRTVACQAPLSMGFPRQEYWSGLPFLLWGIFLTQGHPRCGTSFLLVVVCISILCGAFIRADHTLVRMGLHLLLLPLIVAVSYEINRFVGKHDNACTRFLTLPGQWMQNFTTYEPDDDMIEVAILALKEVLPEQEGSDQW